MPQFSPVSSAEFIVSSNLGVPNVTTVAAAPVGDKLAALLGEDEPLPQTYARDRIRLVAQSPRRVNVAWDLARDPFAPLEHAFGGQYFGNYALYVRLINEATGDEIWQAAGESRSQWFDAQPNTNYRAEVGLYAAERSFIRLLNSSVLTTPRASVAPEVDAEQEFQIAPSAFARVLDEAGYVNDALEVTLEAADDEAENAFSTELAQRLGGIELPSAGVAGLVELRGLLSALALGMTVETVLPFLSPALRDWLLQARQRAALTQDALLELLRETLGLTLHARAADITDAQGQMTQLVIGGTRVNLPAPPFHLWLPSMNARRLL